MSRVGGEGRPPRLRHPPAQDRPRPVQGERPRGLEQERQSLRRPREALRHMESLDQPVIKAVQVPGDLGAILDGIAPGRNDRPFL